MIRRRLSRPDVSAFYQILALEYILSSLRKLGQHGLLIPVDQAIPTMEELYPELKAEPTPSLAQHPQVTLTSSPLSPLYIAIH
jgi:hypothetical protein